jgi:hypothetical protein
MRPGFVKEVTDAIDEALTALDRYFEEEDVDAIRGLWPPLTTLLEFSGRGGEDMTKLSAALDAGDFALARSIWETFDLTTH